MNKFDAGIAGVTITVVVALAVTYAKARKLKFDTFTQWNSRVATAKVQLEDLTLQTMLSLQRDLNQALNQAPQPGSTQNFTFDPSVFQARVLEAANCYKLRQAVEGRYGRARSLAGLVPRALELALVAGIWMSVRFSWKRVWWSWSAPSALIIAGMALILLIAVYLIYLQHVSKLQQIVVRAQQSPPP